MKRAIALLLLLLIVAGLLVFLNRIVGENEISLESSTPAPPVFKEPAVATTPPTRPAKAERSTLADELNATGRDIQQDLRLVTEIIATFRTNFLQTGNPTGTNAEITAALGGRNPLRLALIPPDHPAINRDGELCDRWGTPFFFHAESATRMEIRSAGPDRTMWNDDDVAFAP